MMCEMSSHMNKRKRSFTANHGFTLVELMMAVVIFTILISMVMVMILTSNTTYHSANARITGQEDLRRAMRTLIHELSETSRYRVAVPTPSTIAFQIPVRDISGGSTNGQTVDDRNNIIFGARLQPTTVPDGYPGYAVQYVLIPNNDISNSHCLVRRVLDNYPSGNQVGSDIVIANAVRDISYSRSGETLSIDITAVKNNKFGRDMLIRTNVGVTMRN